MIFRKGNGGAGDTSYGAAKRQGSTPFKKPGSRPPSRPGSTEIVVNPLQAPIVEMSRPTPPAEKGPLVLIEETSPRDDEKTIEQPPEEVPTWMPPASFQPPALGFEVDMVEFKRTLGLCEAPSDGVHHTFDPGMFATNITSVRAYPDEHGGKYYEMVCDIKMTVFGKAKPVKFRLYVDPPNAEELIARAQNAKELSERAHAVFRYKDEQCILIDEGPITPA